MGQPPPEQGTTRIHICQDFSVLNRLGAYIVVPFLRKLLSLSTFLCRLPSPPRRTMVEGRGRHNGLPHRGRFTAFKHLSRPPTICSMTRAATVSSLRSPSKPREELRLQGISFSPLLQNRQAELVTPRLLIPFS